MGLERYFIPRSMPLAEKQQQAASLLARFILISTTFVVGYFLITFITGFLLVRYLMVSTTVLFILQLLGLRYGVSIRITSHFFVVTCWLILCGLVIGSGGVLSYVMPWVSLIPVMALVLLGKRAAWRWGVTALITVIVFLIFKPEIYLPTRLVVPTNTLWIASLHMGLVLLMLILTYIFFQQKNELITTIERQNQELARVQKITEDQHKLLQIKNVDLESEIEKRTHELVHYNQQLEQFTFMASHNLRSPIARILGLASLLETPLNPNEATEIRQRLLQSTRDLDQVVRDLNIILNIRKNSDLVHIEMNLATELQTVLSSLESDILATQATIRIQVPVDLKIQSVRPYLHSIITNLISNSLKYNKPNTAPEISITSRVEGDYIIMSIQDEGIGMDINTIKEKIFTLYSRFHTHVEGRGIGLYLVKAQMEALGGALEVNSKVNQGTEFTLMFKQFTR